ncbi:hypothetical protein SDC9_88305 [bioreactor metagenome]|uniref:Uncharacterized protein n=1 Tax=bioreactor metagenome TaxID=1076179 RepID=A0A644ZL85_9ZZZZ
MVGTVVLFPVKRQSPVHNEHLPVIPDHDVGRFEVAMDDALAVGEGHAVADGDENFEQPVAGVAPLPLGVAGMKFAQNMRQRNPHHPLHGEVGSGIVEDAQPMHRNYIRMVDLGGNPRFTDETGHEIQPVAVGRAQNFDGDFPVEHRLVRGKNRTDAADADGRHIGHLTDRVVGSDAHQLLQLLDRYPIAFGIGQTGGDSGFVGIGRIGVGRVFVHIRQCLR